MFRCTFAYSYFLKAGTQKVDFCLRTDKADHAAELNFPGLYPVMKESVTY